MTDRFSFVARVEDKGRRLDQVLAQRVPGLSRRKARLLLDIGGVFVDRKRTKVASVPVREGQQIVVHQGGAAGRASKETGREARERDEARLPAYKEIFEDEDVLVVDKPAGLLTAPTPESDRNNLLGLLARADPGRPGLFLVHRLDLPTSGVLVFAKTDLANQVLGERFRQHDLVREYLAVVAGAFPEGRTSLNTRVGGRAARTDVKVERRISVTGTMLATMLRCTLFTGRTHQIRIHVAQIGHPVLGDTRYGKPTPFDPPRMALHATRLAFPHPRTSAPLDFTSPWPADLAPWLERLLT